MRAGLRQMAAPNGILDVRGQGLAVGVELDSRARADRVVNAMRERGVLMGANGIRYSVLKIRPPLAFGVAEADRVLGLLDQVLADA